MEKIRRAKTGKKLAGVCKGLADALQIDPSYVRLFWLVLVLIPPFSSLIMVFLYGLLAAILPEAEKEQM